MILKAGDFPTSLSCPQLSHSGEGKGNHCPLASLIQKEGVDLQECFSINTLCNLGYSAFEE